MSKTGCKIRGNTGHKPDITQLSNQALSFLLYFYIYDHNSNHSMDICKISKSPSKCIYNGVVIFTIKCPKNCFPRRSSNGE